MKHIYTLAFAVAMFSAPALADENGIHVPCGPLSEMKDVGEYRLLTHDEWLSARTMFFLAPDTPADFPPGDRGLYRDHPDGTASIVFVDGDDACAPMRLLKGGVAALKRVRAGEITHAAGRL